MCRIFDAKQLIFEWKSYGVVIVITEDISPKFSSNGHFITSDTKQIWTCNCETLPLLQQLLPQCIFPASRRSGLSETLTAALFAIRNLILIQKMKLSAGNLPSVGGDDDGGDKEKDVEEERLRQEAIKEAEEKRRIKHKKMEEERENMRQGIRDKVSCFFRSETGVVPGLGVL